MDDRDDIGDASTSNETITVSNIPQHVTALTNVQTHGNSAMQLMMQSPLSKICLSYVVNTNTSIVQNPACGAHFSLKISCLIISYLSSSWYGFSLSYKLP
jgi:hypothetical protein